MKNIPVLYILSNDTYELAIVSLQSVIISNPDVMLNFYFAIDSTFNPEYLERLKSYDCYKNVSDIKFINIDENRYKKFANDLLFSNRIYALKAVNFINENKVIFISVYTIITSSLSELYETDISSYSCAGTEYICQDSIIKRFNLTVDKIYSSNVLLINVDDWKENKYYKKTNKQLLSKFNNENFKISVWILFNAIIPKWKQLNYKYDYTEEWWYAKKIKFSCSDETEKLYHNFLYHMETPVGITYGGVLPIDLNRKCHHSYKNLWWKYAEKSLIYNEIKEYRNLNKYKLATTSEQNSFKYSWLLSRIWPYIKPYWFRITLGFLIAIPLGLLDGVTAFALKPYMDYVIGGKTFAFDFQGFDFSISSMQMSFIIPFAVILFAALQGVLRYLNDYLSAWTSTHITNDVKFDLFHRLVHMHPQFFDENSSGIVLSRYMADPKTASAGIVENIKTITTSLCGAFGLIFVMLYSSWKLAIIGIFVLCIAFIPVVLIRKRIRETSNKSMVVGSKITTNINETYSGNKVMAAYGLQDRQEEYFREKVWEAYDIGMSLLKRTGWMSPLMYLIASFGIATVLGYGTYLINSGQMSAGSFASFVTSLLLLYKPVKTLGNTLTGIQGIFVAMGRVFELFDLEPEIKDTPNAKVLTGLNKSIKFEDVCFEYIPNQPVLKHLNLTVAKNETLAIVGNSGGGKSTLVNLLPRFYDIKSGSIKFDDVDIREYTIKSLRENISMVFQDNFLYSGTIRENILMGNPNATSEELVNAIKSAHLEEMIKELPDGLETELGERGLTLSGGQRQRVAIARAMIKNAPIVILDEATSALDNESEAIVQKAMDNLMQDRTVFIIAHRLSTIKNADRIAVINEGQLVELGTHNELMSIENGQYRALYEMQFKKQEVGV